MKNYKLIIQYDGTDFAGWQIQKNAQTVQEKIIDAIEVLLKERVNLIGSGRTDAGVHALGQAGNFRTGQDIEIYKFQNSLNAILPKSISVKEIEEVGEEFHARFDAAKRSYIYLITNFKSPFFYKYSYYYTKLESSEIEKLNKLSKYFLGNHNFTSLSRKDSEIKNKDCIIHDIHWRSSSGLTTFHIQANRFLHGMVRTVIGTLLYAVENNLDEKYLEDVLAAQDRTAAAESAPAKGLFLYKVRY